MFKVLRRTLPLLLALGAVTAHAQFYSKYLKDHGGSLSFGATGQFDRILTSKSTAGTFNVPNTTGVGTVSTIVSNQQQFTTNSTGFVTELQFHPVSFAGISINYGFTHKSERYSFNYTSPVNGSTTAQVASSSDDVHELTAAYLIHPKHIPFQPFVNIGGGSLDFASRTAGNQWRGAGLLEAGFDLPTHNSHLGFRVSGRSLYYRSPNFSTPAISTGSWRATVEPAVSSYIRF